MPTPAELLAEVLSEHAAYEAYDSEMSPNPYHPRAIAEKLATPDSVPFLVEALERGDNVEVRYAAYALEKLGSAGRGASAALEKLGEHLALFAVDEPRARELGLHRSSDRARYGDSMREVIATYVISTGAPERIAAHFAGLLGDADEDVVLFALDRGGYRDRSGLSRVVTRSPDSAPLAALQASLVHSSPTVRMAAVSMLEEAHLPGHASAVLAMRATDASQCIAGDWLGSLPGSEQLLATVSIQQVFEIVRRRRCAGLTTNAVAIRERLRAALEVWNDWRVIGHAARSVAELGDTELLDPIVDAIGASHIVSHFDDMRSALRAFGAAGLDAARRGRTRWTGERATKIGWLVDELARPVVHPFLNAQEADVRFIAGELEDYSTVDNGAYGAYAATLLREPKNLHAAMQCAWIDRGFGTPITSERIHWLHTLGAAEDLLVELATRPLSIVPDHRAAHHRVNPNPELAVIAERAGLFGIAANYALPDQAQRLRERAKAHLARSSQGCAPQR